VHVAFELVLRGAVADGTDHREARRDVVELHRAAPPVATTALTDLVLGEPVQVALDGARVEPAASGGGGDVELAMLDNQCGEAACIPPQPFPGERVVPLRLQGGGESGQVTERREGVGRGN
jgi:hypothetical protein